MTLGLSFEDNPAASYSSIERLYSTIGAGGLNGRVRDGIGCITSAIATGNRSAVEKGHCFVALGSLAPTYCLSTPPLVSLRAPRIWRFLNGLKLTNLNTSTLQSRGVALVNMVKPHDQLVPVSFNHY